MASNGYLPASELAPIVGGGSLTKSAAAGWNAFAYHVHKTEGWWIHTNGPQSSYRDYAGQVYMRNYWCNLGNCGNAAVPGTSNHGWGKAVDVPSAVITAILRYGAQFGFSKSWSDAAWEAWHHLYQHGHYNGPDPLEGGGSDTHDPYPPLKRGSKNNRAIKKAQKQLSRHNLGITRPKVDGDFGKTTEKAVKEFQWNHGLDDDGEIGDNTWAKLRQKDVLFKEEITVVNRYRLAVRNGVQPGQEDEAKRQKQWLEARVQKFKNQGEAGNWWWSKYNRRKRYRIIVKSLKKSWR